MLTVMKVDDNKLRRVAITTDTKEGGTEEERNGYTGIHYIVVRMLLDR